MFMMSDVFFEHM